MVGANVQAALPTKQIDMYKDHQFVVGKLTLGVDELHPLYGVLLGAGRYATGYHCTCSVADHHFLDFELRGLATSGSSRFLYANLWAGGAGSSPSGIKMAVYIEDAISVANAGAITGTVRFGTAGSKVVGEAQGVSGQLRIPDRAVDAGGWGTTSAGKFEIYLDGTSSDITPAGAAGYGVIRLQCQGGNQAARRKVLNLIWVSAETGNKAAKYMACNADVTSGGSCTGGLQVHVNGTQYWIPLYSI